MSLIKKYNGKEEIIADKSIIDHNQLSNRDQYGAHSISAIRKLPEKLTQLKNKDEYLQEEIDDINTSITSQGEQIEANKTNIKNIETKASKIDIKENEDSTFTFTNYNGEEKNIQSGFLPDENTLTLNDSKKMTLKQVHTDTSLEGEGTQANPLLVNIDNTTIAKRTDGKLEAISLKTNGGTISGVTVKEELDNLNTDVERLDAHNSVQDNEIYDLQSRTKGMGGYLNSYNFGDFSKLTTEEVQNNLTAYALQQISITEKTDIFDGTKVINDYDRHLWRLTNTPNSNPVVFEWADLGITQEVSTATDSLLGLVKGSNGDLKGKVDINGEISINGLRESLNDLAEDITLKQDKLNDTQLAAVNSGITNSLVTQISTNTSNISSLSSNKANDNAVVHLTEAETISGIKTFSANTVFTGNLTDGTNSINIGGIVAKANKTTSAEYTLAAANWNNNTYTLSVTGKTANNNADVTYWQGVSDSETQSVKNNMEAIQEANIYQIIDNGTSLTLVCENIPVVDLKIQVEVYE